MIIPYIFIIIISFCIIIQDLTERSVFWFLFPLLFIFTSYRGILLCPFHQWWEQFYSNIIIIIIELAFTTIYLTIKKHKFLNIINSYIGLGDILFFIVVAAAFNILNFILFLIVSLVFGILWYLVVDKKKSEDNKHVPLAGIMAFCFCLYMIIEIIFSINPYKETIPIK